MLKKQKALGGSVLSCSRNPSLPVVRAGRPMVGFQEEEALKLSLAGAWGQRTPLVPHFLNLPTTEHRG